MSKKVWILVVLSLLAGLGTCCTRQTPTTVTPTPTLTPEPMLAYTNDAHHFSFIYPSVWMVQRENDREIILVPIQESAWEPAVPADIPQDPRIKVTLGKFAVAGVFETYPETITPEILRMRLEESVVSGVAQDFLELRICKNITSRVWATSLPDVYRASVAHKSTALALRSRARVLRELILLWALSIGAYVAFGITERSIPGCYKVIYWRPDTMKSIVRISTGCESFYLSDFELAVNSMRQVE